MSYSRLPYVNLESAIMGLKSCAAGAASYAKLVRDEPMQPWFASLATELEGVGLLTFAVGGSISSVRDSFAQASGAWLKVFELRGSHRSGRIIGGEVEIDYSTTNSHDNFRAACGALMAGEFGIASRISALAWDPPKADYIHVRSDICTPGHQHFAYALRSLFAGDVAGVARELQQVRVTRSYDRHLEYESRFVQATVDRDTGGCLSALTDLLEWHGHEARKTANVRDWDLFLAVTALGLSSYCVRHGLLALEELPKDCEHFPTELVSLSQHGERGVAGIDTLGFSVPAVPGDC